MQLPLEWNLLDILKSHVVLYDLLKKQLSNSHKQEN